MRSTLSLVFVGLCICAVCGGGCDNQSADQVEQAKQEKIQQEAIREAGMPLVKNFTEKKLLKWIYELRDQEGLQTYTYITDMNGHLHFLTESIGYGFPYATQYTSPSKVSWQGTGAGWHELPQAEVNGLFMPASAEGTWIIAATEKGPKPIYVEQRVIVSPIKLKCAD